MTITLKYGCNPHQPTASAETDAITVRNGNPSMINFLDALNAWQLVDELRRATDLPSAASFKHVSPAGAAVAVPLDDDLREVYEVGNRELTPLATAYVRARGADPKCSFGDFVALSHPVDEATANYLKGVVSDGVIAPGFEGDAALILASKKGGSFIVFEIDPNYRPPEVETREVFGVRLTQTRNNRAVELSDLDEVVTGDLTDAARRDLLLGLVTLKYTQSNSVGYAKDGQMIGIGAGQQSRVDCTKLAGTKADTWYLGLHPKVRGLAFDAKVKRQERINWRIRYIEGDMTTSEQEMFDSILEREAAPLTLEEKRAWLDGLDGVAMVSDGYIPFRDNIDHAQKHGVRFVAQPGGSNRDGEVAEACREYGISMAHTSLRLFHH